MNHLKSEYSQEFQNRNRFSDHDESSIEHLIKTNTPQGFEIANRQKKRPQVHSIKPEFAESILKPFQKGLRDSNGGLQFKFKEYGFQDLLKEKESLITSTETFINQLDFLLSGTDSGIILTDERGVVLRYYSKISESKERPAKITPGMVLNEKQSQSCCSYDSENYYSPALDHMITPSVPIHDSYHKVTGTLCIACKQRSSINSFMFGLVNSLAWAIESSLNSVSMVELFSSILETNEDAAIAIKNNGCIISANKKAKNLFINRDKLISGQNISGVFEENQAMQSVFITGKPASSTLLEIGEPQNKLYTHLKPVKNYCGKMAGFIMTLNRSNTQGKCANKSNGESQGYTFEKIVTGSPQMIKAINLTKKFAHKDVNILIQGETGTGKEVLAQSIHNFDRPNMPFIAINCAAIPDTLIESEFFGYEGGAFTGAERCGRPGKIELANSGTLFLDEIGEMPLSQQSVLLRVIEEKKVLRIGGRRYIDVDFKLIAATNKSLLELVKKGLFRQDLYYRLSVFNITIPSLKERDLDIIRLAQFFVQNIAEQQSISVPCLSESAKSKLLQYSWPGNIRQLENAILYAANVAKDGVIQSEDIPITLNEIDSPTFFPEEAANTVRGNTRAQSKPNLSIKDMEKFAIIQTLHQTENNVAEAANILGLSRTTLYRKIKEYKIQNGTAVVQEDILDLSQPQ